jgi:hypothetical protein
MNPIRAKYQRRNITYPAQTETEKPKEARRATTTIIETKMERPYSRKVIEQRVEMDSEPSNNRFGKMPKTMGRYSAIISNKTDNEFTINTTNKENPQDKYKRQNDQKENDNKFTSNTTKNSTRHKYRWSAQVPEQKVEKEPVKWKRFSQVREEEKPRLGEDINNRPIITSKTVKEEKTEKTPNAYTSTRYTKTTVVETERNNINKPDEKVVKTEVQVVTKTETPKEIENKKENNGEPKANYRFRRFRVNKTDEDLPPKKEDKEKEDIKVESRKRKTLEVAFNPYSRNLKDKKIEPNTNDNNADNKDNADINKRGYNYYKKKNDEIEQIDNNNKADIDNADNEKNININEDRNDNPNQEKTDDSNYKHNSYKNENPDNSNNNKYKSYTNDNNNNDSKYRTTKTEPSDDTENNYKYKSYSKFTKKDGNKKVVKEETIEENINETDRKNRLKKALNEIERVCADRTLKNDLIELFNRVLENNREFKDDIFFRNLTDTERRVGNMDKVDKKKISHTYKEIETREILANLENANDLLNKYTQRAKTVVEEY